MASELEMLYRISEAKFLAESMPGVGSGTLAMVLECDANKTVTERYLAFDFKALRRVWQDHTRQIPADAEKILDGAINSALSKQQVAEYLKEELVQEAAIREMSLLKRRGREE